MTGKGWLLVPNMGYLVTVTVTAGLMMLINNVGIVLSTRDYVTESVMTIH